MYDSTLWYENNYLFANIFHTDMLFLLYGIMIVSTEETMFIVEYYFNSYRVGCGNGSILKHISDDFCEIFHKEHGYVTNWGAQWKRGTMPHVGWFWDCVIVGVAFLTLLESKVLGYFIIVRDTIELVFLVFYGLLVMLLSLFTKILNKNVKVYIRPGVYRPIGNYATNK